MEIYLWVDFKTDNSFIVHRQLREDPQWRDSILKLDYKYTPWIRKEGNLLW